MDEHHFWSMIEDAWAKTGSHTEDRRAFASEPGSDKFSSSSMREMISMLEGSLEQLSQEDLLSFDQILERKLYDIDRIEIHRHTDGSDDGFLYARGFIVAMGRDYYSAIVEQPSLATRGRRCEEMCYLSMHAYTKRFGRKPRSGISRESFTNPDGNWKEMN